jgi:hypothetical protein
VTPAPAEAPAPSEIDARHGGFFAPTIGDAKANVRRRVERAQATVTIAQVLGAKHEGSTTGATTFAPSVPTAPTAALLAAPALGADTSGGTLERSGGGDSPSPFCPPSCSDGSFFGLASGGAGGAAFGGFVVALTPFRLLAAPGAGWLLAEAPDLGRPADTSPLEHPG